MPFFFVENLGVYEIRGKILLNRAGQMTIWRMRIACWLPKATKTPSKYVILIPFPLQLSLHESVSMLGYTVRTLPV